MLRAGLATDGSRGDMRDDEPSDHAATTAAVPGGRASRLLRLGTLAGGVAGSMLAEGARQFAQGKRPRIADLLLTPSGETLLEGPRVETRNTHGTGCTLASACAAGIALGRPVEVAVAEAWAYVAEAIRRAPGLGGGHGPLDHAWPVRRS